MAEVIDPRLGAISAALHDSVMVGRVHYGGGLNMQWCYPEWSDVLAAIDSADRDMGIVRVNTRDGMLLRKLRGIIANKLDPETGRMNPDGVYDVADDIMATLRGGHNHCTCDRCF